MNPKPLELALRKQRLQFRAEQQRADLLVGVDAVDSVLHQAERLREGVAWLRHNAPAVSTFVLVLLVIRPRFTLRWARRGLLAWQLYRRLRSGLASLAPQS